MGRLARLLVFLALLAPSSAFAPTLVPEIHFPLPAGGFWIYQEDLAGETTWTVLEGSELVNGVPTTVVETTGGLASGVRESFTNDEDGLRLHKVFVPGPQGGTAVFRPPLLLGAAEMDEGETVSSRGRVDYFVAAGSVTGDYSGAATFVRPERVEVPAGSFDALRVDSTLTLSLPRFVERTDATTWLAAHVGEVREVSTAGPTLELVRTNVPEPSATALGCAGLLGIAALGGLQGGRLRRRAAPAARLSHPSEGRGGVAPLAGDSGRRPSRGAPIRPYDGRAHGGLARAPDRHDSETPRP